MSAHARVGSRAGFTMIELMVGLALLGLILVNVYMVLADSSKAYGSKTLQANTEMQLRRTLDRIALAVMSSSRGTLWTATDSPLSESELHYETSLGMENGVPIWSDLQKIGLTSGEANYLYDTQVSKSYATVTLNQNVFSQTVAAYVAAGALPAPGTSYTCLLYTSPSPRD